MKISFLHLQRLNSRVLNIHEIAEKFIYPKPQKLGSSEAKHVPWINVQINLHLQAAQWLLACFSAKLVASGFFAGSKPSTSIHHQFTLSPEIYCASAQVLSHQSHRVSVLNVMYCPGVG